MSLGLFSDEPVFTFSSPLRRSLPVKRVVPDEDGSHTQDTQGASASATPPPNGTSSATCSGSVEDTSPCRATVVDIPPDTVARPSHSQMYSSPVPREATPVARIGTTPFDDYTSPPVAQVNTRSGVDMLLAAAETPVGPRGSEEAAPQTCVATQRTQTQELISGSQSETVEEMPVPSQRLKRRRPVSPQRLSVPFLKTVEIPAALANRQLPDDVTPIQMQFARLNEPATLTQSAHLRPDVAPEDALPVNEHVETSLFQSIFDDGEEDDEWNEWTRVLQRRSGKSQSQRISRCRESVPPATQLSGEETETEQRGGGVGKRRDASDALQQAVTLSQAERAAAERWKEQARQFFQFIDQRPLLAIVDDSIKNKNKNKKMTDEKVMSDSMPPPPVSRKVKH